MKPYFTASSNTHGRTCSTVTFFTSVLKSCVELGAGTVLEFTPVRGVPNAVERSSGVARALDRHVDELLDDHHARLSTPFALNASQTAVWTYHKPIIVKIRA